MALIRYPGSKEALAKTIIGGFPWQFAGPLFSFMDSNRWEYREPFLGAGAIGLKILEIMPPSCKAWLNDKDYSLICMWQAVWNDPERLIEKVLNYTPRAEDFFKFKEEDGRRDIDPIEAGFRKLVLHQISYSGIGGKAGGPLGGKNQDNELYPVDCRWNPSALRYDVARINQVFNRLPNLRISCQDGFNLIEDDPSIFIYLDPPYYEKGKDLYLHPFEDDTHVRLSILLKKCKANQWQLSYDDHPRIRELYKDWCDITDIEAVYTINRTKIERKNQEVLIIPRNNGNGHD